MKKEINMKMTKQDAFTKFGSYLSVQVGEYDSISEHLGSYEDARKSSGVINDQPLEWIFPNTDAGLTTAMQWALESRLERRHDCKFRGIEFRQAVMKNRITKIRILKAKLFRNKEYLKVVEDYEAKTAEMIVQNDEDDAVNIKFNPLKDELDLGLILDIGSKVFTVGNNHGGVTIDEYEVMSYSTYDCWDSSTVDVIIHNNFGVETDRHRSHVPNEYKVGNTGYVNQKIFYTKSEAKEQAREWAQELVDKNSEWL